jgi:hypothetical protein
MIDPKTFYNPHDDPTERQKAKIWNAVAGAIAFRRTPLLMIADRRSFFYGIAAAVIVYLAGVGLYHQVKETIDRTQPAVVQVDYAYQSAITALERAVPAVLTSAKPEPVRERLRSRYDQLRMIDGAILEMKKEANGADLSAMSRSTMRDLYSMKLKILQQMIEQGELEP